MHTSSRLHFVNGLSPTAIDDVAAIPDDVPTNLGVVSGQPLSAVSPRIPHARPADQFCLKSDCLQINARPHLICGHIRSSPAGAASLDKYPAFSHECIKLQGRYVR